MTTLTLADLFDRTLLDDMVVGGFVRAQRHPSMPLVVYNYTEACQYAGAWNEVTLACRGLILDEVTGAVVARPFTKFFNHGQPGAPDLDLATPVAVTDKADGSLGVLYATSDGLAVATRGSFASDQAVHATRVLRSRYPDFTAPPGLTVLVEIIYPSNRIVVDYGDLDDLVLLGAVQIDTGRSFGPEAVPDWPGPIIERFEYVSLAQALAAAPRPGREGLVIHDLDSDVRVKIKYEEYVRLHRIVTGLTARVVWEHLAEQRGVSALIEALPDELHGWVHEVADALTAHVTAATARVEATYRRIVDELPTGWGRKEFALRAVADPDRGLLFLRLDGKDVTSALWQQARPAADWSPRNISEADSA